MLSVADTAAELAEHAAKHDAHGYSQPNRAAVGTGATAGEWVTVSDGRTYGIATGDYDCSSLAIQSYAAQGVDCGGAWSTSNMKRKMVASGNFVSLPRDTWRNPQRGDLLLAPGKHVAVALGGGRVAEAVRSENHSTHGRRGDQDGGEIIVRDIYDDGWTCVLRYCGPEREQTDREDTDMTNEQAEMLRFVYDHMHWDEDTHFSGLGNLVAQQPIEYADRDETASIGERLRYIDAHTHVVDEKLDRVIELLESLADVGVMGPGRANA